MHDFLQNFIQPEGCQPGVAFSMGGFGALAEFCEPLSSVTTHGDNEVIVSSTRGAMSLRWHAYYGVLAYEALSADPKKWQCGILIYAPHQLAKSSQRSTVTELGPDVNALDKNAKGHSLFDIGVGLSNVDFCVRTNDVELKSILRANIGKSITAIGHKALEAIIDCSPNRVMISRGGRIEIYQPIDRHQTPVGPHTHLLPDLLRVRRTHSASIPLPRNNVPLLTVHPENPLTDDLGHDRPFSRSAFDQFERLLEIHGESNYVAEKTRLREAIKNSVNPASFEKARSRSGRLAHRVALRQLSQIGLKGELLAPWQARLGA